MPEPRKLSSRLDGSSIFTFHEFPTRTLKSLILGLLLGAFWEPFGSYLASWELPGEVSWELPGEASWGGSGDVSWGLPEKYPWVPAQGKPLGGSWGRPGKVLKGLPGEAS